jgi:AcrR family transcriptional regulator
VNVRRSATIGRPTLEMLLVARIETQPTQRARSALSQAFVQLVLERRYDQLRVGDIIARAGVGRSTFYEHFQGKDDLLKEGLSGPFSVLADTVTEQCDATKLLATVEHFWEHRRIGNVLFAGMTRPLVIRVLSGLIQRRLARRAVAGAPLPPALLAAQIAGAQMELLAAWLAGRAPATAAQIAQALRVCANSGLSPAERALPEATAS